jgi:hypothetical protein
MIKLQKILQELSKTGVMTGSQEKIFNTGLRKIHTSQADMYRDQITKKTPHSEINYGGCGIFAKLLYYNMKKYLNITPEIVCFDWPGTELPKGGINKYKSLVEFNNAGYTCIHITLKINDYYIDSSGVHKLEWYNKVYGYGQGFDIHEGMTIQTLTKWVSNSTSWNSTFNRYTAGDINKDMIKVVKEVAKLEP